MQKSLAVLAEFTSIPGTTVMVGDWADHVPKIKSACPYLAQVQSTYSTTDSVATILSFIFTLICYRNEPTETPFFNW